MDKGKHFTFNTSAFPRYHYFHIRLKGLVPRWQRILDAGSLPDCISEGVSRLKEISATAAHLSDQSNVYLFAEEQFLRTNDLELSVESDRSVFGEVGIYSETWTSCRDALLQLDFFQPYVVVIAKAEFDTKVFDLLSGLNDVQLGNIILYNTETKKNVLYTDLAKAGFQLSDVDLGGKNAFRHASLSGQIQHLLEEKVVGILELISDYIHPFVPRPAQFQDEDIQGVLHTSLREALSDTYVVSDIEPAKPDLNRVATREDLEKIAKDAFGRNWTLIAPFLDVSNENVERIQMDNQDDITAQNMKMLQMWSEQLGSAATLQSLDDVMKKVPASITNNWDAFIDGDKNATFQTNLMEFLNKKSRCVTCSNFSKKYGIPEHIVNEFLNDGFYGYDKKFSSYMKKTRLPEYPPPLYKDLVDHCRDFVFMFIIELKDLFDGFEKYVQAKLKALYVMLKLQYELYGMLRLADVEIRVAVPPLNVLSKDLQEGLLDNPGIEGCGTFYGELWLHLRRHPSRNFLAEIREMLECYKYHGGFKWDFTPKRVEQALGLLIEPGQSLRACLQNGSNQHIYGSLGCFVKVSPKDPNIGQNLASAQPGTKVSEAGLIQTSSIHAITCAHCVKDCEIVEVKKGDDFVHFGRKRLELYYPDLLDVATIDIQEVNTCVSDMKRFDGTGSKTWTNFPGNPCGLQVQKDGSRTKFTKGIVMSSDYVSKIMQGHHLQRLKHNICIESLPDLPEGINLLAGDAPLQSTGVQFSNEGDSGSVVCADNPENSSVFIVSLLMGAVVNRGEGQEAGATVLVNTGTGHKFSYSSEFRSTLEELKVQYDVEIEPAVLTGPPPRQQDRD